METNKCATMLHKNIHMVAANLIYAVLEWILILLLLLNSSFTYLISKFAIFFNLQPPCLWCSRMDHIFEQPKNDNFYRDLVCNHHSAEISRLGFCLNHKKLAECLNMCEDCFSSVENEKSIELSINCSCCNLGMEIKHSHSDLDYTQKEKQRIEASDYDKSGGCSVNPVSTEQLVLSDVCSGFSSQCDSITRCCFEEDDSFQITDLKGKDCLSIDRLIPVEVIDSLHSLNHTKNECSFFGSCIGEVESLEKMTIEGLKVALKAVNAELEEERNASAIAANQTMAMITRLQEEKAAMKMEALQYQRMMEEQSEYDQEALNLLNEVVIKREKEKEELENELKMYRNMVIEEEEEEQDEVGNDIDESLEEKLKVLEEKITKVGDEQFFEEMTGSSMAKILLPLLDKGDENGSEGIGEYIDGEGEDREGIEEMDDVYERLQALEAEREFLKHCVGSMKKGDKGMDLLEEILEHLRDLKDVEVRLRTIGEDSQG